MVGGWVVLLLLLLRAAGRGRGLLGWYPLGRGAGGECLGLGGLVVGARVGWVVACCSWIPCGAGGRGAVAPWGRRGGNRRAARF